MKNVLFSAIVYSENESREDIRGACILLNVIQQAIAHERG